MKQPRFSLPDIFARLARSAPVDIEPPEPESSGRVTQSVRFPPEIRHWIAAQAKHCEISQQDFITLTMKGVMEASKSDHAEPLDLIVLRFFQLFKAHGIATADIPDFLPADTLLRSELRDNDKIVNCLTPAVVQHLEALFHINGDWLLAKSDYIYQPRLLSKNLPSILGELTRQKLRHYQSMEVLFLTPTGIRLNELAAIKDGEGGNDRFLYVYVVVKINQQVAGQQITTYQLWDGLAWDHQPSRLLAKALLYFGDRARIYPTAYNLETGFLNDIASGKAMLSRIPTEGQRWDIEELAWDDDRNTELDELDRVKAYFKKEGGEDYLTAIRDSTQISNLKEFMAGKDGPRLKAAPVSNC